MPTGIYEHKKGQHHSEATKRKISLAKMGYVPWNKGIPRSEETKEKISISKRGKKNPNNSGNKNGNWNGGKTIASGYVCILYPQHPFCTKRGYVKRSRLVMEAKIGRYLKPEEVVHHINTVRNDDRIKNLKLFPNDAAHTKFHKHLQLIERNK